MKINFKLRPESGPVATYFDFFSKRSYRFVFSPRYILLGGIFFAALIVHNLPTDQISHISKKEAVLNGSTHEYYSYSRVSGSFSGKINYLRANEFAKPYFEQIVMDSVPFSLKNALKPYLKMTLALCEKHQLDPFWALAIMWTESHFRNRVVSSAKARGLMQIMPPTGLYLANKLDIEVSKKGLKSLLEVPNTNIEMGIYYLKHLLKMFKGNYILATVSYNMGPYRILKMLRDGKSVGVKNFYLNKVARAYRRTSLNFVNVLLKTPMPYLETLVLKRRKTSLTWIDKTFSLFPYGIPEDVASTEDRRSIIRLNNSVFL